MTTPEVTSYQVRAELEDLLGPTDGPEEALPPGTPPAAGYMLGRLMPRERVDDPDDDEPESDPDLVDREVSAPEPGEEDDDPKSEATVRSGSMAASAIGLAFSVPTDISRVTAVASWGRYERRASEVHETERGRARITWHRIPFGGEVEVPLETEGSDYLVPGPHQEGVTVHFTACYRGKRWRARRDGLEEEKRRELDVIRRRYEDVRELVFPFAVALCVPDGGGG